MHKGFRGDGGPPPGDGSPEEDEAAAPYPAPEPSPPKAAPKSMDDITLDRALVFAILAEGLPGYFKARKLGLEAAHLQGEDAKVFAMFEQFSRKGRLPTFVEIAAGTGQVLLRPEEPYDVDLFAGKVADRALQNKLKDGMGPISRDVLIGDPHQARRDLHTLVRDTAWSIGSVTSYTDPEIAMELRDDYKESKAKGGGLLGLSSPWPNVDKHSLGIQSGELTVLLAKRKTGKSWLLFKWAAHCMRNDLKPGESVLIISMEMTRKSVYRRLAAIDLRLDYQDFRSGRLTTDEEIRLFAHCAELMEAPPGLPTVHVACADTIRDVADICDKVAELRPRAVFLDGLYILGRDKKLGMWERTITNCAELKLDLCSSKELPVGVVATSQLKGSKDKNALDADADDAAYAKAIGDWADAMRGCFMNEEYEKAGRRVFAAMESREFRGVDLQIQFNLKTMNFDEIKIMGDGDEDEESPVPAGPVVTGHATPDEPPPAAPSGHDEAAVEY